MRLNDQTTNCNVRGAFLQNQATVKNIKYCNRFHQYILWFAIICILDINNFAEFDIA